VKLFDRLFLALSVCLALLIANSALGCRSGVEFSTSIIHDSFSEQVSFDPPGLPIRGVGIGFVRPGHRDIPPLERPQTEEFRLAEGEPFVPFLILHAKEQTTFLVTVLLDYRQVPFELDGRYGLLHEVTIPPNLDVELPMRVDIEGWGAHDLIVVAFADPHNHSMDPDYRDTMAQRFVGRRAVIVVGSPEEPARHLTPDVTGSPPPPGVTFGLRVAFATASETHPAIDPEQQMFLAEGQRNKKFPYRIWVSNYHGQAAVNYALTLFLDFHQIKLNGKDVLNVHLEAGHEVLIDTELILPAEPGVHELQIVYVMDPYRSILRDEVTAPFVFGSPRLGIKVQ
jgi:hypothetical protein